MILGDLETDLRFEHVRSLRAQRGASGFARDREVLERWRPKGLTREQLDMKAIDDLRVSHPGNEWDRSQKPALSGPRARIVLIASADCEISEKAMRVGRLREHCPAPQPERVGSVG